VAVVAVAEVGNVFIHKRFLHLLRIFLK